MATENTFEIVSKVAYLAGVRDTSFRENRAGLNLEVFMEMETHKPARIVRRLALLRTVMFQHHKEINQLIYYDMKNIDRIPEYIQPEILSQLREDGVEVVHVNWRLNQYITLVSELINQHINDCSTLFPIWINWDYIKELFVADFKNDNKLKTAMNHYFNNRYQYPFQTFLCGKPDIGNIFFNDQVFVDFLYEKHGQKFKDGTKLHDACSRKKESIYQFIEDGDTIDIVVDCENANVFKLFSVLEGLSSGPLHKIRKIFLYNDSHTSSAWNVLKKFTSIEVVNIMVDRIKENKSLVDMQLAVGASKEHFVNNVDSFILVSSDSDYWGLISGLSDCRFLVMIEYDKTSAKTVNNMKEHGIAYCHIDDFCSGSLEPIQMEALLIELRNELKNYRLDLNNMLNKALENTRVSFAPEERERFMKRYFSKFSIKLEDNILALEI